MWDAIIIQPFTNLLLLITMLVKNFGFAIIIFTILIKLLTYPLTAKQLKSTKEMQDLQSDPQYIKMMEKYKDNKEKAAEYQMKKYQEKGISPLGSCLPTLIQFPIIIGLYQAIMRVMASTPLELVKLERLVYPFLDVNKILPIQNRFLWMDLGQPERLYVFGIAIPVLAILVVLTTFIQSKVMQPPATNDQAGAMNNSMTMMMPIMMGYMAYQFSAGLALYFLTSNLTTIVQYAAMGRADWSALFPWIEKKVEKKPEVVIDVDDDEDDEDDEEPEPVKIVKPSARASAKQQRPKMKR